KYRFEDLPPGELELVVVAANQSRVKRRIEVVAAEAHVWDAVLANEGLVHGRLLDHAGGPLAGWFVARKGSDRFATTGANGRFGAPGGSEAGTWRRARPRLTSPPVRVRFDDVVPGETVRTFVVPAESAPSARIRGRCLAPDGAPLADAVLNVHQEDL